MGGKIFPRTTRLTRYQSLGLARTLVRTPCATATFAANPASRVARRSPTLTTTWSAFTDVYGNVAPLLGHVTGVGEGSGYPALVDEVGAAFNRSDAVAMLKEVESLGQVPDFDIEGGFMELSRILFREVCVAMSCPGVQDEQDSQAMLMWVIMNTYLKGVLQRLDQKQIESLRPVAAADSRSDSDKPKPEAKLAKPRFGIWRCNACQTEVTRLHTAEDVCPNCGGALDDIRPSLKG